MEHSKVWKDWATQPKRIWKLDSKWDLNKVEIFEIGETERGASEAADCEENAEADAAEPQLDFWLELIKNLLGLLTLFSF